MSRASILRYALAAVLAFSLIGPSLGDPEPYYRMELKAPILFSQNAGGDDDGGPPDTGTNDGPLALYITTPFPAWATVGDAFFSEYVVAGGRSPYGTSTVGSFPPGLMLNPSNVAGAFTTPGSYSFQIRATDSIGSTPVLSDPIPIVVSSPLVLEAFSPATVSITRNASVSIAAPIHTGGLDPVEYSISPSGQGATVDISTGEVSFVSATLGLAGPFVLTATDDNGRTATSSISFDVTDAATLNYASPEFSAVVGQAGIAADAPTGLEAGTKTFAVIAGALPAGLSLDATTGQISGTPTAAGNGSVTIRLTYSDGRNAAQTLSWAVVAPLGISYRSGGFGAMVGQTFAAELPTITGGTGGALSFAVTSGALGGGMVLNPETGGISMTPTAAGSYDFTITATEAGTGMSASVPLHWQVYPTLLVAYSTSTFSGVVGQSLPVSAPSIAGGNGTISHYGVATGALPAGLTLNPSTGAISGSPTAVGTFPSSIYAEDTSGFRGYASLTFGIQTDLSLHYGSASYSGSQNSALSIPAPTVSGGTGAGRTFSVASGALPSGLTLNPSTGAISGTASGSGSSTATIQVLESGSGYTATATIGFDVVGTLAIDYAVSSHTLTVGTPFAVPSPDIAGGSGGTKTFVVSSGSLPAGISLNATTGQLSGTPTTAGSTTATIQATESGSGLVASDTLSFTTIAQLTLSYSATSFVFTTGTTGTQVAAPSSSGGSGTKVFSVQSGALPSGFSLNSSSGAITGTTSATGSSGSATIQVTDGTRTASQTLSWSVLAPVGVSLSNVADRRGGSSVSMTISATGGTGTTTYSHGGTLPAGLTRSGNLISGTLSTPGSATTYNFSVTATNAGGTQTQNYSMIVYPALAAGNPGSFSFTSGSAYTSATPSVSGLRGTATWSLATGSQSLPTGMTLNTSTGVITASATSITPNVLSGFVLRVKDSADNITADSSSFTITINGASCSAPFNSPLAHGSTITAFQSATVTLPNTCTSEVRTCNNGILSGSYTNQSCTAQNPTIATVNWPQKTKDLLTSLGVASTSTVNGSGSTTFSHNLNGSIRIASDGDVLLATATNITSVGNYCTQMQSKLQTNLPTGNPTIYVYGAWGGNSPYWRSDGLSSSCSSKGWYNSGSLSYTVYFRTCTVANSNSYTDCASLNY